jgi:hypothetical protein
MPWINRAIFWKKAKFNVVKGRKGQLLFLPPMTAMSMLQPFAGPLKIAQIVDSAIDW